MDSQVQKITVYLIDEQILFRKGMHFILSKEEDIDIIGESTGYDDALDYIKYHMPNVVIMNISQDMSRGIHVIQRVTQNIPSVAMVPITDIEKEGDLLSAMKSGASACITKDMDPQYLLELIRMVAQGNQPIMEALLMPGMASRALIEFEDLATLSEQLDNMLASLAPVEMNILKVIAAGKGIEQVAEELDINEENIRRSLRMILNKLVANDQSRALIDAAQRSMPSIIGGARPKGVPADYVTKEEFNEFKDNLMERLKSFIGEMT